jgi:hypothetical protein
MAYVLDRFGAVALPPLNPKHDLDTVQAKNSMVRTVLGGFDTQGSAQADLNLPQAIRYSGFIVGGSLSAWRTAIDTLRGTSRTRAQLWRYAQDNNEQHSCYARYVASTVQRSYEQPLVYETTIQFLQLTPWVGHNHRYWTLDDGDFLDDGLYLDDGGYTFTLRNSPQANTVTNGGNRATRGVRLTVTAGSTPITAITFACGDAEITYSGAVAAGQALVIDSGAQSVMNNGVADYAHFALTTNHTIEDWLLFAAGANTLTVTRTGGSSDSVLLIEFQDGWE